MRNEVNGVYWHYLSPQRILHDWISPYVYAYWIYCSNVYVSVSCSHSVVMYTIEFYIFAYSVFEYGIIIHKHIWYMKNI